MKDDLKASCRSSLIECFDHVGYNFLRELDIVFADEAIFVLKAISNASDEVLLLKEVYCISKNRSLLIISFVILSHLLNLCSEFFRIEVAFI